MHHYCAEVHFSFLRGKTKHRTQCNSYRDSYDICVAGMDPDNWTGTTATHFTSVGNKNQKSIRSRQKLDSGWWSQISRGSFQKPSMNLWVCIFKSLQIKAIVLEKICSTSTFNREAECLLAPQWGHSWADPDPLWGGTDSRNFLCGDQHSYHCAACP